MPARTMQELNGRAVAHLRANRPDKALDLFDVMLKRNADLPEVLNNSAVILAQKGAWEEAARRLRRAVAVAPAYAQAHANLGLVLQTCCDHLGAVDAFRQALAYDERVETWWRALALSARAVGRHDIALSALDQLCTLNPDDTDASADRGATLFDLGRDEDAVRILTEVCRSNAQHPVARANLALLLKRRLAWSEAEQVLLDGLYSMPEQPILLEHLATLYLECGLLEPSLNAAERIVARDSENPAGHNALANVAFELGRFDDARRIFRRALECDGANATALWNLALLDLLDGNLERGLAGLELRRTLDSVLVRKRVLPGPEWDGGDLTGKSILVHEEQGIGDILQFVRYATQLKARGAARVIFECPEDTASLIASAPGVDDVARSNSALPMFDTWVPLMSLPLRCGTLYHDIPGNTPYLSVLPTASAKAQRDIQGFKVGIVWGGNPQNQRDRYRSIPVDLLLDALQVDGVRLFSLQKGPHSAELAQAARRASVVDLAPFLSSMSETAAVVNELDLVVTVCTSIAHLSGALHRPTFTLLASVADWRWFRDREDSPWYPSMRLFRQQRPGDWSGALRALRNAVIQLRNATSVADPSLETKGQR